MTVTLPSIEVAVIGWLETLDLPTDHIGTRVPAVTDDSFVRVQDLGGPHIGQPQWVFESLVQIDSCGSSHINNGDAEAETLHNLIRAAIPTLVTDECVIARVSTVSLGRLPDPTFEPVRPRFVLQTTLRWRPN